MKICKDKHEEVCYVEECCPVCIDRIVNERIYKILKQEIIDLKEEE